MSHHTSSSHNDKTEPLTKNEWQTRLESFEFKQADMNKLIMNYLVTGTKVFIEIISFNNFLLLFSIYCGVITSHTTYTITIIYLIVCNVHNTH